MGREAFEVLGGGVLKRKAKRRLGLFIDGIGLDRATRRLSKKVDLERFVSGIRMGVPAEISRYYSLIPYEDDSRQFAFLEAVERAGLEVVVKRLPPKGVKRQVSMDVHIASDLLSFGYGHYGNANKNEAANLAVNDANPPLEAAPPPIQAGEAGIQRIAIVVCPSRELSYALHTVHKLGIETSLADFGFQGGLDTWKGVDNFIDLSTSETIWRD